MPDSMSPLRFLLFTIIILVITFSPPTGLYVCGPKGAGTLRAEESPRQDPPLEGRKLDLEVKKLRQELSAWGKVERLAPAIAAAAAFIGAVVGAVLTFRSRNKELRLNTITNLKRELASENPAVRITAVHALADYPKEAIPTLIASLGSTRPAQGGGHSKIEEDTAFTSAVKDSLRQIGKKAVYPLIKELERIRWEIRETLMSGEEDKKVRGLYESLPFDIFSEGTEAAVRSRLKEVIGWVGISLDDREIELVVKKLDSIRSSKSEELLTNKNGIETLSYLLSTNRIKRLKLSAIDLSGASLWKANLSGASLGVADLSGVDLREANLSGAWLWGADLSGADLRWANLSGANLVWANLKGADLREANLDKVNGFGEVKDFSKADLSGVKGLSRDDLEYAKSKGAMIDEPAEKPKEPPPKADGQP